MKSRQLFINLLICGLLFTPASSLLLTGCSIPSLSQNNNNQLSQEKLNDILKQITVKIITDDDRIATGTLIQKYGSLYTVVTNDHVVYGQKSFKIQTADNQIYQAKLERQRQSNQSKEKQNYPEDMAILTFFSDQNYSIARISQKTIKEGDKVLASGFVKDQLKITEGKVKIFLDEHLKEGHQIAYTNEIEQGMSGGAIINSKGELIGINARYANPVIPDFTLQDGSKPDQKTEEKWAKYSWGLPVALLDNVAPELELFFCNKVEKVDPNVDIPKQIECIAKAISVRIVSDKAPGTGVIIARENGTYWVLTANHVVERDQSYRVETPDGNVYEVDNKTIQGNDVSDIAVFQFKSKEDYQVATLGNYPLDENGQFIFLYGWQAEKVDHPSVFSVGLLQNDTLRIAFAQPRCYELAYTNLAYSGMSGGAILDTEGRVIGIHNASVEDILDYSFGMSINRFLLEKFTGIPGLKKDKTQPQEPDLRTIILSLVVGNKPDLQTGSSTEWLKYATQLWRSGYNDEALKAINIADYKDKKSDSYQAFYNAGFILWSQGKYDDALRRFDNAISIRDTFYRSWFMKGITLDNLKRYEEAVISYTKAIEEAEKDHQKQDFLLYFGRAGSHSKQGNLNEAIADYNEALKINPNLAGAYNNRGLNYYQQGNLNEAIADYTSTIKINPNYAQAYFGRGLAYANRSDYSKAIADYKQALKLDPNLANIVNPKLARSYIQRGNNYLEQKNYTEAINDFTQAINIDSKDAKAYFVRRGIAYFENQQYSEAINDFKQALKLDPKLANTLNAILAEVYTNRGVNYFKQEKYTEAINDYKQALKLNPKLANTLNPMLADAYTKRGANYFEQEKYTEVINDFTQAIQFNSNDANIYFGRGIAYFEKKQYSEAINDFKQALKLDPKLVNTVNPELAKAYFYRGVVYSQQGNSKQAIYHYDQAIKTNPNLAEAYFNRAMDQSKQGNEQQAIKDLQKAKQLFEQQGNTELAQKAQDLLNKL